MFIAKMIANEVDLFMDREKTVMNHKSLRQLEKDIEGILTSDPRIGPLLHQADRTLDRRDRSQ